MCDMSLIADSSVVLLRETIFRPGRRYLSIRRHPVNEVSCGITLVVSRVSKSWEL